MTVAHRFVKGPWSALLLMAVLLGVLCLPEAVRAQEVSGDTTQTRQVEIVAPSDSLVQTIQQGAPVQKLIGHVRLRQGTTYLRADRATRFRQRGEILFTGDVFIVDEGDSLWADRVRYDSRRKVGRAKGHVRLADGQVTFIGPTGRYSFREKHAVFPESVTLVDSARVLKSRSGEYFSKEKRAEFYGDVRSFSDSTYLEADSVTYFRDTEVSEARGRVFIERRGDRAEREGEEQGAIEREEGSSMLADTVRLDTTRRDTVLADTVQGDTLRRRPPPKSLPVDTVRAAPSVTDTTARTLLFGHYAYNDPRARYSRVVGRALLIRLQPPDSAEASESTPPDSAGASKAAPPDSAAAPPRARPDTLILRAHRLETVRSDTLRRLTATDSVRLWQQDLQSVADSSVYDQFPPDEDVPDSAQVRRRETRLFGRPLAWSEDAQLNGDTLRVTGRGGTVRRLFARGRAFAVQEDTTLGRLQQLKGRRMTGYFAQNDSTGETELRSLLAGPNAEAIRFLKGEGGVPNGAVRVSSDSIHFRVRDGEVRKVRVLGGVQGRQYDEENVPNPFQLEGMVWVPERRPQKGSFLEEGRVRRRLLRPEVRRASTPERRSGQPASNPSEPEEDQLVDPSSGASPSDAASGASEW